MISDRRRFVRDALATTLAVVGGYVVALPRAGADEDEGKGAGQEKEVGPTEDLMREHGVLRRVLLIYEETLRRMSTHETIPGNPFLSGANLIRHFIQDYHERNEEQYVFPPVQGLFTEPGIDLPILLRQHQAGRKLIDMIIHIAGERADDPRLVEPVTDFIRMYRAHTAREDTVIFPALLKQLSDKQLDDIGERFEESEKKLFGEEGFTRTVFEVVQQEKSLGIYDLSHYTPKVESD